MNKIALCDFGSEFRISILSIENGIILPMSTNSGPGVDAIDELVSDFLERQASKDMGATDALRRWLHKSEYQVVRQKIEAAAKNVRREIGSGLGYYVSLGFLGQINDIPFGLEYHFSRNKFVELMSAIFDNIHAVCRKALSDAHMTVSELDSVLLIGDGARLPGIFEAVTRIFKGLSPQFPSPAEVSAFTAASLYAGDTRSDQQARPEPPPAADIEAASIVLGGEVRGVLEVDARDFWYFDATSGTSVQIDMIAMEEALNVYLALIGPEGVTVDNCNTQGPSARLQAVLSVTGTYYILAGARDQTSGSYSLKLMEAPR